MTNGSPSTNSDVPDGPWTQRRAWRSRHLPAHADVQTVFKLGGLIFGGVGVFILGKMLYAAITLAAYRASEEDLALGIVFLGIGLSLGAVYFVQVVRSRLAAQAELTLHTMPVPLGGVLRGVVQTGLPAPEGVMDVRVRFGCYKKTRSTDSDGDTTIKTRSLWENERIFRSTVRGTASPLHEVPIAFDVPSDQPPSAVQAARSPRFWRIRVIPHRVPAVLPSGLFDRPLLNALAERLRHWIGRQIYQADVYVPVFDVDAETAQRVQDESQPDARQSDSPQPDVPQTSTFAHDTPQTPGVMLERDGPAALTLTCKPKRRPGQLALTLGGTLASVVGTAVGWAVSGWIGLISLLAVGGFGYVALQTLHTVRLTVGQGRILVERLGVGGSTTRIPFQQIAAVRAEDTTLVIEQTHDALDPRWANADVDTPASMIASVTGASTEDMAEHIRTSGQSIDRQETIDTGSDPLETRWLAEHIRQAMGVQGHAAFSDQLTGPDG